MGKRTYKFQDYSDIYGTKYIFGFVNARKLNDVYHNHDFYELVLLLKGTAVHEINKTVITMQPDDCVILRPEDSHRFIGQSQDLQLISLSVSCEEFALVADSYELRPLLDKEVSIFSCVHRHAQLKIQSQNCQCAIDDDESRLLLSMMLCSFKTHQTESPAQTPPILVNAVSMLRSDKYITLGIPALMELTKYSRPHLNRLIKQYYGMTPHELIHSTQLDVAYSKLFTSDISVAQIANSVGFSNYSYFIQAFKKKFGVSPTKLRKQKQSMLY